MPISDNDISQSYQSILGRAPTAQEIEQFKRFGSTGAVDLTAADIAEIIGGLPEAQEKTLGRFGQQYGQQLAGNDQQMLDMAGKSLTQQFNQLGRGTDTSAYINAFAGAARDLAMQRQSTLAQFYGQGYQGIMGQQVGQSQANRQFGLSNLSRDYERNVQRDLMNRHGDQYQDMLNKQSRQNKAGAIMGLAGAGLGAATGALVPGGGLAGARFGGSLGGSLGQGFGSFF